MKKIFFFVIFIFLSTNLVLAQSIYADCSVYGNCKKTTGNIFINNTNVTNNYLNGTHNLLEGLQGGSPNEYYHLNVSRYNYLNSNLFCLSNGSDCNSSLSGYYPTTDSQILYTKNNNTIKDNANFTFNDVTNQVSLNRNNVPISPPTIAGTAFRINCADNEACRIGLTGYGTGGMTQFSGRSARGTGASPTFSQVGDLLAQFDGYGRSTSAWALTPKAMMKVIAGENYTDSAQGTFLSFWTTKKGTIIPTESMRVDDGNVTIYANETVLGGLNIVGNINATGYNITGYDITAEGYLMGQPLTGMFGGGLIQSTEGTNYISGVNLTCTGLNCLYNSFVVRLASVNSQTIAKYCSIPAGTLTVPDNTFSAYYVDSSCTIQYTTYDDWYTNKLGKEQAWDFAHVIAHGGTVETSDTISLEQKRLSKLRVLTYYLDQAHVVSGFNFQTASGFYFNITSGKSVFGMDVVDVNQKNITATGSQIELVGHATASTWRFDDQRGLNVTACDTGSAVTTCTGNGYRRHFIFVVGYDDPKNVAEVHQLYALQSLTYTTLANCTDTISNPLTYTIPPEYTGAVTMLYAYCARRTDTSFNTGQLLDLRTVRTGFSSGGTDISGLVPYTGATGNVDLNSKNLSNIEELNALRINSSTSNSTNYFAGNRYYIRDGVTYLYSPATNTLGTDDIFFVNNYAGFGKTTANYPMDFSHTSTVTSGLDIVQQFQEVIAPSSASTASYYVTNSFMGTGANDYNNYSSFISSIEVVQPQHRGKLTIADGKIMRVYNVINKSGQADKTGIAYGLPMSGECINKGQSDVSSCIGARGMTGMEVPQYVEYAVGLQGLIYNWDGIINVSHGVESLTQAGASALVGNITKSTLFFGNSSLAGLAGYVKDQDGVYIQLAEIKGNNENRTSIRIPIMPTNGAYTDTRINGILFDGTTDNDNIAWGDNIKFYRNGSGLMVRTNATNDFGEDGDSTFAIQNLDLTNTATTMTWKPQNLTGKNFNIALHGFGALLDPLKVVFNQRNYADMDFRTNDTLAMKITKDQNVVLYNNLTLSSQSNTTFYSNGSCEFWTASSGGGFILC